MHIVARASIEVIDAEDFEPIMQEALAEVRAKTSPAPPVTKIRFPSFIISTLGFGGDVLQ